MSQPIAWDDVLKQAASTVAALAPALPQPAGTVAAVAAAIAGALIDLGCAIEGCDGDGAPQPADIPTGEAGLAARADAIARSRGLDRRGIDERRRQDADELDRASER
jgi:hypothetical protein